MYLDKNASEAIKGVLILLIVFGHNHVLCPNDVSGGIMDYLYQFHVMGFFILPFFYGREIKDIKGEIGAIIIRCWVPYFWICILCWLVYSLFKREFDFGWEHIYAFFNGTQTPIRTYFGFVFPWFLPAFCSFSIMLMLSRKYKNLMWTFFILSVITYFFTWEQFFEFKNTIPLGIGLAIHYFASGVITFYLHRMSMWSKYVGAILFVLMSVCWWNGVYLGVLVKFMPSAFFLTLICILPFFNKEYIRYIGNYSLGIYLLHMFFVNATYMLLPRNILWGIIGFVISLLGSLLITHFVCRMRILRVLLFPKSWNELNTTLRK